MITEEGNWKKIENVDIINMESNDTMYSEVS